MKLVATLVSSPRENAIDNFALGKAATALDTATTCQTLADRIAIDLFFEGCDQNIQSYDTQLRIQLRNIPLDIIVQPAENRKKKLFLADMDSTMIQQECIDELADFAGFKEQVASITEQAMRGEIDFEPALRKRVSLLRNLRLTAIQEVIKHRLTLTPGGQELLSTLRKNGTYTCLVSGGFTVFTEAIAQRLNFHEHRSNTLGIKGDCLDGTVCGEILGRTAKLESLLELRKRLNLAKTDTLAVGDGANDLDMIREAGLGVAFHAKPLVAQAAQTQINHGDLTALLYMQGYKMSEFSS